MYMLRILCFFITLTATTAHDCSAQQLKSFMPQDQVVFEQSLSEIDRLAREALAAANGNNLYRAKKLQADFDKLFPDVFAAKTVNGWLCKHNWLDDGRKVSAQFSQYIAMQCNTDQSAYLLLFQKSSKTEAIMAEMTFGRPLRFNGEFFNDLPTLYQLQLNALNFFGPIVFVTE